MSTSDSFEALRDANPRNRTSFADSVEAVATVVRTQELSAATTRKGLRPRRRLLGASAAAAAAVAGLLTFLTLGSPSGGPGVESARAAVEKAAVVSAASAEQSGTVTVRMTHDGQLWADKTVRWNGSDVEIADDSPGGPSSGLPLVVVDGMMYGHDPQHTGWAEIGPVSSIDPGSGTTPTDILDAVREDVGGTTLRRLSRGIARLVSDRVPDGSTVYRGTVPAGMIARETGFKEGQAIRVLPFGYVAHDEAANPNALLDAALTVGADGIVRELVVTWGTWRYAVTYDKLGTTPPIVAPANAPSLLKERLERLAQR